MTLALAKSADISGIERVLLEGDLSALNQQQRETYYMRVCESVGLNPLTQPFEYLKLNGKTVLYARRACTDQLRKIHSVSVTIVSRERMDGVYVVTARAALADGRCDESIGAVPLDGMKGENLANALMKAETKAKRRVTLAICGLSMLDESEMDGVKGKAEKSPLTARTLDDVAGEAVPSELGCGGRYLGGLMVDLPQCVTKATLVSWARELLAVKLSAADKADAWAAWANQCADRELVPADLAKEARAK